MPVPAVAAAFVRCARLILAALAVGLRLSAQTTISGTYNGTAISGDIVIAASTSATFTAGASFSGANATFNANSGLYWQQVGTLTGKTITLGSGAYLYVSAGIMQLRAR